MILSRQKLILWLCRTDRQEPVLREAASTANGTGGRGMLRSSQQQQRGSQSSLADDRPNPLPSPASGFSRRPAQQRAHSPPGSRGAGLMHDAMHGIQLIPKKPLIKHLFPVLKSRLKELLFSIGNASQHVQISFKIWSTKGNAPSHLPILEGDEARKSSKHFSKCRSRVAEISACSRHRCQCPGPYYPQRVILLL